MTFIARMSRRSAAGSPSRKSSGIARQSTRRAQEKTWPVLARLTTVAIAVASLATARATTPTAEDGFAPGANAQVVASAIQPDGRIIVAGYFTELQEPGQNNPVPRGYIGRLNPDGSIDMSFNPGVDGPVEVMHLQADGKIIIGGYFTSVGGIARNRIARLEASGGVDPSFNPNLGGTSPSLVHVAAIAVDSSSRVLVGGEFTTAAPNGGASVPRMRMVRLAANGDLDTAFNPTFNNVVRAIAIDGSGRIVVGGGFTTVASSGSTTTVARRRIVRLSDAGVVETSFDPSANNLVTSLAFQADGKLIAAGHFTALTPNGASEATSRSHLARILDDGTLDANFRAGVNADVYSVAITPDGRIVVSGVFRAAFSTGQTAGTRADYIARFAADGTLDSTFFPGPSYAVRTFAIQRDGKIFIGGYFKDFFPATAGSGIIRRYMARLNEDGSLDTSLSPSLDRGITVLTRQSDGRILLGGSFTSFGGATRRSLARMTAEGAIDPVFDPGTNGVIAAIAVQPDGGIIVGGQFSTVTPSSSSTAVVRNFLARFNANGTLDTGFNPNPNAVVSAIAVQPDGKILIGGNFTNLMPEGTTEAVERNGIARLLASGAIDTAFSPGANNAVTAIVVESDNRILIGGGFSAITNGSTTYGAASLARLNADGSFVTAFTPATNGAISSIRILGDGKILISGSFSAVASPGAVSPLVRGAIALMSSDGTIDPVFDPNSNGIITTTFPLADGKILVAGSFTGFRPNGATETITRNYFARINSDGTVDAGFDPNPDRLVTAVLGQPDGGAIIAGLFTSFRPTAGTATQLNRGLARITGAGAVDVAFKPEVGGSTGDVRAVAYQRDGTMFIGGQFASLAGSSSPNLVRMISEGIVDTQFQAQPNGSVEAIALRSLVVDNSTLNRRVGWLEKNGTLRTGLQVHPNLVIDGVVEAIAVQSDGKFIIGGSFSLAGPGDYANLARFNTDGSLDTAFKPDPSGPVYDIKIQSGGRILIGGAFTSVGGVTRNRMARLSSTGEVDATFNPNASDTIYAIALHTNDRILIGGIFTTLTPNGSTDAVTMNRIARLHDNGTVDSTFNPNANSDVSCIAVQSDNKILIGGLFTTLTPIGATTATTRTLLARLNEDGTVDEAFDPKPNSQPLFVRQLAGGKILVSGFFTGFTQGTDNVFTARNRVAILSAEGTVDTSFDANANGAVYEVGIEANGSFLLVGTFTSVGGVVRNRIARVSATGALDTAFNPNAASSVNALAVLADESIITGGTFSGFRIGGLMLAGGTFTEIGTTAAPYMALLSTDGTPIVGAVPALDEAVRAFAQYPNGRMAFAGDFTKVGETDRARVARLLPDDTLDTGFDPGADGSVKALAIQADGKLLLGGTFANVDGAARANIARVNDDGSVDPGFTGSTNGAVSAIAVQADGRILVAGTFTSLSGAGRTGFGRLESNGAIDANFAPGVNGPVHTIAIQTDQSILIGGTFTEVGGAVRNGLAKLMPDGSLDTNYDAAPGGGAINTLVLTPDGKLIVGGGFTRIGGESRYLIARLSASAQVSIGLEVGSDKASLNWRRTGSGPEITSAKFEFSTDGSTWSGPFDGVRDSGAQGWRAAGLTLPTNTLFFARARATVAGNRGGSTSFIETVRAAFITSSGGGSDGSEEPPEVPARPANFLAETYLSANPGLANTLYGQPDRLDLAWVHYWTYRRSSDTEGIFLPPGGQNSIDPKLNNLSARSWIGPGEQSLIMGVYVADAPAKILVRALGPSLAVHNIPNPVADPAITIYSGQTPIASNDDWASEPSVTQQALTEAGVTMSSPFDSAMVVTLQPGSYTFVISSKGGTGVGLGELFLLQGEAGRLTNLSARASVGQGGDILIAGFNRVGIGEILVRGLGPELATHNIVNFLADPHITLHKQSTGTTILANDDWGQVIGAISDKNVRAGALPLPSDSKDAAAYIVLSSGAYTIHMSGAHSGQTGVALIELFELR